MRTLAVAVACVLGTWGCKEARPDPSKEAPAVVEPGPPALLPAPEVEIAGCEETLRTPMTCRPSARDFVLRLYVPGYEAPTVRVEPGEIAELQVKPHPDGGGTLVTVKVSEEARALVVETRGAEPWRIALDPMPAAPALDALYQEAAKATDKKVLAALLPRIEAVAGELPGERRVDALRLQMLVQQQLGQAEDALDQGEAALNLGLRTGRVGAAIDIAQVLAWHHLHRGDEAGARWLVDLQSLHAPLDLDAVRRAGWHYYRGLLAHHRGDLRTALSALESAESLARRMAHAPQELAAATQRVILLGALGRTKEQREGIARIVAIVEQQDPPRCEDALELDNAAWALLSDHGTAPASSEVEALFDGAERILAEGGPCDAAHNPIQPGVMADVALGRALAALGRDDRIAAKRAIDRVVAEDLFPAMPPWLHYARAVLALREGRVADALASTSSASRAASAPGASADPDPRLPWRLALLRGHANAKVGRRAAALEAFLGAERIVDGLVGAVGVDQGRESLAAQAQEGAAQAIDLLLADGRVQEAADVARRSRGRTYRPIGGAARLTGDDRERFAAELDAYRVKSDRIAAELVDAWRLDRAARDTLLREHAMARAEMRQHLQTAYALLGAPGGAGTDTLPSPEPGELWLLYHPRAEGWAAFAITRDGVHAESLAALPERLEPERVGELVLGPFDEEIEGARSVLVLPVGALLNIDFAAVPWKGDALVASRPVAWKLDVVRDTASARTDGGRALVVGDPATRLPGLGRLPEAAKEAEEVAGLLRARGISVELRAGEDATARAVISAIAGVDLLHWAGHGRRGDDAWESRLPLAGEASLDLRDVLALTSVPKTVVLTSCETGRTEQGRGAGAGGMHLAAGFVVSGAQLVIAANAEVDDELARAFAAALYDDESGMPDAGIEAVRRASLKLRGAGLGEWTAFRAWVP